MIPHCGEKADARVTIKFKEKMFYRFYLISGYSLKGNICNALLFKREGIFGRLMRCPTSQTSEKSNEMVLEIGI